jgi:phosphoglycolate phosphatase
VAFDDGLLAAFRARYEAAPAEGCAPFPGAEEALRALRREGVGLALCTNKPRAPSEALLRHFGLLALFDALGCGDMFPYRKPDPRHLAATLASFGAEKAQAALLGDHRNDVAAARGLGIPALYAGWGYGGAEMAEGAARRLSAFDELPAAFFAALAEGEGSAGDPGGGERSGETG